MDIDLTDLANNHDSKLFLSQYRLDDQQVVVAGWKVAGDVHEILDRFQQFDASRPPSKRSSKTEQANQVTPRPKDLGADSLRFLRPAEQEGRLVTRRAHTKPMITWVHFGAYSLITQHGGPMPRELGGTRAVYLVGRVNPKSSKSEVPLPVSDAYRYTRAEKQYNELSGFVLNRAAVNNRLLLNDRRLLAEADAVSTAVFDHMDQLAGRSVPRTPLLSTGPDSLGSR